jgi:hypothetical protein
VSKIKIEYEGSKFSFKEGKDGLSSSDFWRICAQLYERATYMNDVNIKVIGAWDGPIKIKVRPTS